ncbi:hypothetical protein CASFOL_025796 [Castilleja foliolosa]|uniref:Uncharacterized protein n=1 Tax=Castilleja foliolosa TaxID=1961234 RepID=A0ABD3CTJ5_9LAMI
MDVGLCRSLGRVRAMELWKITMDHRLEGIVGEMRGIAANFLDHLDEFEAWKIRMDNRFESIETRVRAIEDEMTAARVNTEIACDNSVIARETAQSDHELIWGLTAEFTRFQMMFDRRQPAPSTNMDHDLPPPNM